MAHGRYKTEVSCAGGASLCKVLCHWTHFIAMKTALILVVAIFGMASALVFDRACRTLPAHPNFNLRQVWHNSGLDRFGPGFNRSSFFAFPVRRQLV